MVNRALTSFLDATELRLTAGVARICAIIVALCLLGVFFAQLALSSNNVTPAGLPVGGDYVAFWTAAKAMAAGDAASIYEVDTFQALLHALGPPLENYRLTWQYPPTYFLVIGFLAAFPFGLGYAAWTGGTFVIFAATCRAAGLKNLVLFLVICSPIAFQAAITGQNGFLTASLLAGALLLPDKRPIIAGLCAALLTVKPQLGVLIPFAYIGGGHWRAFVVAALGFASLAGASIAMLGIAPWTAFFASIGAASANTGAGVMPLFKMPTIFSAFALAGAPSNIAFAIQAASAATAAATTTLVWRRFHDPALRASVVAVAIFFTSPYLLYYDLIVIALPLALLATSQAGQGWRPHYKLIVATIFIAPMFLPGDPVRSGISIGFVVVSVTALFVARAVASLSLRTSIAAQAAPA